MLETIAPRRNGSGTPEPPAQPKRLNRRWIILATVVVIGVLTAVAVWEYAQRATPTITYETAVLSRGNLEQSVSASGTVNPQDTISVGTQVSGTIEALYVDFNSPVHTGELLARIDPSQFQAQVNQANAVLSQARSQSAASGQSAVAAKYAAQAAGAALASARSDLVKSQAAAAYAEHTLARDRELLARGFIAQNQYDADFSSAVAANMAVRAALAAVAQNMALGAQSRASALASANSAQAAASAADSSQAAFQQSQLNLGHTLITSPVNGIIVARNVSIGQTVAASFQTPTLFTIAQDLTKMELDIAVGEPDIGSVKDGENVNFSVLAYPNRVFRGVVSQVRVNPTTVANVVTYTVVVLVGNKNIALLPGMTANASIVVARAKNALIVPLQALTYRPAVTRRPARSQRASGTTPWGTTAGDVSGAVVAGTRAAVFALRDGRPRWVPVRVDLVSGMQAAVTPLRALREGEPIVVSDSSSEARAQQQRTATNPAFSAGRVIR